MQPLTTVVCSAKLCRHRRLVAADATAVLVALKCAVVTPAHCVCLRGWPSAATGCTANAWAPQLGNCAALLPASCAVPGRGSANEGPVHPGPRAAEWDVGRGCHAMLLCWYQAIRSWMAG